MGHGASGHLGLRSAPAFSHIVEQKLRECRERRATTVLCKLHCKTSFHERIINLQRSHRARMAQRKLQELEEHGDALGVKPLQEHSLLEQAFHRHSLLQEHGLSDEPAEIIDGTPGPSDEQGLSASSPTSSHMRARRSVRYHSPLP